MLSEVESKPLEIGGRLFARFRSDLSPKADEVPVGLLALLGLTLCGSLFLQTAEAREGIGKSALLAAGITFTLLPIIALAVLLARRRNLGIEIGPFILPPKPEGPWQLVRLRVRIRDKVGYSDLGWLKVSASSVEFRGQLCDFLTTESDWDWAKRVEGAPTIRIAKAGRVPSYLVRFVALELREGRAILDKAASPKLLEALQKVYPSGRPSLLPPIELPPAEPLPARKLVFVALGGAGTGLFFGTVMLLLDPKRTDAEPGWKWVLALVVPLMLAGLGAMLTLGPSLTRSARKKEIERLQRRS